MKTIIRINPHVVDTPERIADEKLPMLAVRMLAEAYSTKRGDEALLVLDRGKDERMVYMTIGSNPPELAIGGRRVWGVFDPPDSQEPVATFFEEDKAIAWAAANAAEGWKIGQIDATDKPVVRVAVTLLIVNRDGKLLMGRLKHSGMHVLPEGPLEVSETIEHAVRRAARQTVGLEIGRVSVSREAPYVNTFIQQAGQHFLSLVMVAEYVGGEPQLVDPLWEQWGWYDGDNPPQPVLVTVQQIIDLARDNTAPPPAPMPENPPSLQQAAGNGRATAKKLPTTKKAQQVTQTRQARQARDVRTVRKR